MKKITIAILALLSTFSSYAKSTDDQININMHEPIELRVNLKPVYDFDESILIQANTHAYCENKSFDNNDCFEEITYQKNAILGVLNDFEQALVWNNFLNDKGCANNQIHLEKKTYRFELEQWIDEDNVRDMNTLYKKCDIHFENSKDGQEQTIIMRKNFF